MAIFYTSLALFPAVLTLYKCVLILFFISLKFYIQTKHLPIATTFFSARTQLLYHNVSPHSYFSINLDTLNLIFNLFGPLFVAWILEL